MKLLVLVVAAGMAGLCGCGVPTRDERAIEYEVSAQVVGALPEDVRRCTLYGKCSPQSFDRGDELLRDLKKSAGRINDTVVREHYISEIDKWMRWLADQRESQKSRDRVRNNPLVVGPEATR